MTILLATEQITDLQRKTQSLVSDNYQVNLTATYSKKEDTICTTVCCIIYAAQFSK